MRKLDMNIVLAKDADIYSVYRTAINVDRKIYNRFLIPLAHDKHNSIKCKSVTLNVHDESCSLDIYYMWYNNEYRFVEVDIQNDDKWLLVRETEKALKEKKAQQQNEEQEPKKRRGRPKKRTC